MTTTDVTAVKIPNWRPTLNHKQKLVAIYQSTGMDAYEAYMSVYHCSEKNARGQSSLLNRTNPAFREYLERLLNEKRILSNRTFEKNIASKSEIQSKLSSMFRASPGDFLTDSGDVTLDKKKDSIVAVREIKIHSWTDDEGKEHHSKTLKLADPVPIAAELSKLAGHYAPEKHAMVGKLVIEHEFVPWQRGDDNMGVEIPPTPHRTRQNRQ